MSQEKPLALRRKRRHCALSHYVRPLDSDEEPVDPCMPAKKSRKSDQMLTDQCWTQVLSHLSARDLMSTYAVCRQLRRLVPPNFYPQLLLSVRQPFDLDGKLVNTVVSYHQQFVSDSTLDEPELVSQVNKVRWSDWNTLQVPSFNGVWENWGDLLQKNVTTLRLVSSQTVHRLQTVNLVFLQALQSLEVCGFGINFVNPSAVRLDHLRRLELDDTTFPDLFHTCPNLEVLKCNAHLFETAQKPDGCDDHMSNAFKKIRKLRLTSHVLPDLSQTLVKFTCLEKLSLQCDLPFDDQGFQKVIPNMKSLRRLFVYSIDPEYGFEEDQNHYDHLERLFDNDLKEWTNVEFRYNGFLISRQTRLEDLQQFCQHQFWRGKRLAELDFDRRRVDKARTKLLSSYSVIEDWYMEEACAMLEFPLVESFRVSVLVEQHFLTTMASKWTYVRSLDLDHQTCHDDRNYSYDLNFLSRLLCLQYIRISGMRVHAFAPLVKAIRDLPHLTTVQLHFVRMTNKTFEQIQQAIITKAQQNPALAFTFVAAQRKGVAKPTSVPENLNIVVCCD